MSYQALARKYRPRRFADVVGQGHVVSALSNALATDRVHHALLFSGTRGVGKTTLARIFAKSLNCDTKGVSADPCGTCGACTSVDEGRFIDLIEVDAASRTRVDDTRELLDNVQYAPTQGSYKVYLIDEVHMLSTHSFNALLKTLEEPPPHVKFLLATTDPQKLPVTVLSRCLQFNLRALDVDEIRSQLVVIAKAEEVAAEAGALEVLARSANGSMRDALSLLDQAVAHGDGELTESAVREMLGMIDEEFTIDLIRGLATEDADALLEVVRRMAERSSDYVTALDDVLLALHDLALEHHSPGALLKSGRDTSVITALGGHDDPLLSPQDVQLFYQIGLVAKRDIALAPDPRSGFEMALLRMLAFRPVAGEIPVAPPVAAAPAAAPKPRTEKSGRGPATLRDKLATAAANVDAAPEPAAAPAPEAPPAPVAPPASDAAQATPEPNGDAPKRSFRENIERSAAAARDGDVTADTLAEMSLEARSESENTAASVESTPDPVKTAPAQTQAPEPEIVKPPAPKQEKPESVANTEIKSEPEPVKAAGPIAPESILSTDGWSHFIASSALRGVAAQLARTSMPSAFVNDRVTMVIDENAEKLQSESRLDEITQALSTAFGRAISLEVQVGEPPEITPSAADRSKEASRQSEAERVIHEDPNVRGLIQRFGATIIPDSITTVEPPAAD